ncbi:transposase [Streptomyces chrestomyceticus]|uniref:transposase n=1 Tax=Streptomyces chrestomyceticus TaxID=68185 RepID=UPI003557194A
MDVRTVLHGIVWKFRTGTAWRDVPKRCGPWAMLHALLGRWALDGTFERMLQMPRHKRMRVAAPSGSWRSAPP